MVLASALPLLHLEALLEPLTRDQSLVNDGVAVAAPDDLAEVLKDASADQQVD
jgi:hypothetical protein